MSKRSRATAAALTNAWRVGTYAVDNFGRIGRVVDVDQAGGTMLVAWRGWESQRVAMSTVTNMGRNFHTMLARLDYDE